MKSVILAAGYATRLYPLTENFPKPLLEIGESTILGRLIDDIDSIELIDEHIVVTNHKFVHHFQHWAEGQHTRCPIRIVDDGSETNETRLGAVKDLLLAMDECKIDADILVLAADNLLDFSFRGFVEYAKVRNTSCIMCHHEPETWRLQRTGVIQVDENMRVLEMQEKPEVPLSHWAVPPFYVYLWWDLPLIRRAIDEGCGTDAPGSLARHLIHLTTLHAYPMPGKRHDIGSLDSYEEAKTLWK